MRQSLFGRIAAFITRNLKHVVIWGIIILVGLAIGLFVYDAVLGYFTNDPYLTYDENGEKVVIDIPPGSSGQEIGEILEETGLVKNATLFRYKAQFLGDAEDFQYGTYTFIRGMNYTDIVEILKTGCKAEGVMITIVPGWTIEQIGQYLQDNDICLKDAFVKACESYDYDFDYYGDIKSPEDRRHLLEGYICADTIEIIPANGVDEIVRKLLRHTELIFESGNRLEKAKALGMTVDDVLIMASVVEKESGNAADSAKIARVFMNRDKVGEFWGSDVTVWYALGMEEHASLELTFDLIEKASWPNCPYYKYNTYVLYQDGIYPENGIDYVRKPIGPICNPSITSIDAVLNPASASNKWLFFFYDAAIDKTVFFNDAESFNAYASSH